MGRESPLVCSSSWGLERYRQISVRLNYHPSSVYNPLSAEDSRTQGLLACNISSYDRLIGRGHFTALTVLEFAKKNRKKMGEKSRWSLERYRVKILWREYCFSSCCASVVTLYWPLYGWGEFTSPIMDQCDIAFGKTINFSVFFCLPNSHSKEKKHFHWI